MRKCLQSSDLIPCFFAMALGFAVVMGFDGDLHGTHVAPAYIMMCVAIMGLFSACPLLLTWATNNTAPAGRRAMISSMTTSLANLGGIAGSFMFLDSEAPVYRTSFPHPRTPSIVLKSASQSMGPRELLTSKYSSRYRLRTCCSLWGHWPDWLDYPVLLLAAVEQETRGCQRRANPGEIHGCGTVTPWRQKSLVQVSIMKLISHGTCPHFGTCGSCRHIHSAPRT